MINDLLDANRIHAGQKLPIRLRHCEMLSLVRAILSELNKTNAEKFVLNAKEETIEGEWDPQGLTRAIENLCDNAVKYGDVREPITVSLSQDDASVHLSVHNHGKALTADEQTKIFRPFLRTAAAEAGHQSGWGIGLTFVR